MTEFNLPDYFMRVVSESFGSEEAQRILEGSVPQRTVTLRANTLLSSEAEIAAVLQAAGIAFEKVPWYSDAFVLPETPVKALWELDAYKDGKMYLQSLSSMLPPLALAAKPGMDVLDMCAAPGGKTTQMAALGAGEVHITACEMSAPRAEKLQFNLERQGVRNVNVMVQDARKLDDFFSFDAVLLDAPCSGSGTLRAGDPKDAKHFKPDLVKKSCQRQAKLLDKALRVVKPGGVVVYSTCSVLPCEDAGIVKSVLARASRFGTFELEEIDVEGFDTIPRLECEIPEAMLVCPDQLYEGFFMTKIRRKA